MWSPWIIQVGPSFQWQLSIRNRRGKDTDTWKRWLCEDRGWDCSDAATKNPESCQQQPGKKQTVLYSLQREWRPTDILMSDAELQNYKTINLHCFDGPSSGSFVIAAPGIATVTNPAHGHLNTFVASVFPNASCCFLPSYSVTLTMASASSLASLPSALPSWNQTPHLSNVRKNSPKLKPKTDTLLTWNLRSVAGNPITDPGSNSRCYVRIHIIRPHLASCIFYLPRQTHWTPSAPSRSDPCTQSPKRKRLSYAITGMPFPMCDREIPFKILLKCHLLYESFI